MEVPSDGPPRHGALEGDRRASARLPGPPAMPGVERCRATNLCAGRLRTREIRTPSDLVQTAGRLLRFELSRVWERFSHTLILISPQHVAFQCYWISKKDLA